MTSEPPRFEFHTKTLSPLSPVPVHPPEPSNIPVLRNQIDPVFNMTSTHIEPKLPSLAVVDFAHSISEATTQDDASSNDESSFSDAYKEHAVVEGTVEEKTTHGTDVSDDYAMTFESDGEEPADSQDLSQAIIEPETKHLLVSDLPSTTITNVSQIGTKDHSTSTKPPPQPTPADPSAPDPARSHSDQFPEQATAQIQTDEDASKGGIDIQQLLDNITANAEKTESASSAIAHPTLPPNVSLPTSSSGLPPHSSLPPRPQIPPMRSNTYHDESQKYQPAPPGVPQSPSSFRPPGVTSSLTAFGAPGTSTDPRGGLPPPPPPSFLPPSLSATAHPASLPQITRFSGQDNLAKSIESREEPDDIDARWGPEVQKLYDEFLENERKYVTEGLWASFPLGSRLFIGNLPSEKVTKRDLFHVFHKYGKLAQVSIKQAYGFIQFHDSFACTKALQNEQGCEVRGRRMHLEISKPQKNTVRDQGHTVSAPQRSRSPDHSRGGMAGGRQGRNSAVDRYDGRSGSKVRHDEYGRPLRSRDDYRPRRSPSPPRVAFRGREDYTQRGRESFGQGRGRSRSRSPYSQRDNGRYRERSSSPRSREVDEDSDLQIPRRDPTRVPDVQIILMDQLDRAFVAWVEGEMRSRGIKTETMFLSPRLSLQAVIRRQILEGVHGVSQLDLRSQNTSKIPLQVFDRQGGANNVRFDEYRDLEPNIAAELVLRAKQIQPLPAPRTYTQPQYAPPPQYLSPTVVPGAPNLANLVGQLDNAALQQLLSTLNAPQQNQNVPAVSANGGIDLAGLLGGLKPQATPQNYQQQVDPYSNPAANPALASLIGNVQPPQGAQTQPQQQQQVQNIMAQLARFRQ